MADHGQPIRTPLPQRIEDFRRRTLPVAAWSVAALVVLALLFARTRQHDYIGLAHALQYEISASAPGTLASVPFDVYDEVERDDVVARLDDAQVLAALDTAAARIRQLDAQLEATRTELMSAAGQELADWTADLRRFQIDEESRRLDLLALKVVIENDEIELERLALELRRAAPLVDGGLLGNLDLEAIELQHTQVARRLEENKVLLAQTEEEYRTARRRRLSYEAELPSLPPEEPSLRPLREAITVESNLMREIEIQRGSLVLRSPVSGQVSQVLCRKGQSVVPGEPILLIAERSVQEIVAYLRESDTRTVEPDSRVLVSRAARPGSLAESVVVRVAPTIEMMPERLWNDPRVPDYGRAVVIAAAPGMRLTPGEAVRVRFLSDAVR